MPARYLGERPASWGPIGTLIMIHPKAPTAKPSHTPEDKSNTKSSVTTAPSAAEPVVANPTVATNTDQAK